MSMNVAEQLGAARCLVFGAIDEWNAEHPHPLRSRREHGSVNVTHVYANANGMPTYTITIVCALSGSAQLAFHGQDLGAVAEHARLTLEHRIAREIQRRVEKLHEGEFAHKYGVAV